MDWELKESAWNFTNVPQDNNVDDSRVAALVGSNNLRPNGNGSEFSVDLKLGRLGDDTRKVQKYPSSSSSPSGSSKRGKSTSETQNLMCLVDGCVDDLKGYREYHRRHRVCERHSKTPVVSIGGNDKRFCQQCSRFQSVAEFDDEKRSCRKRLDGHNRRRRKPQPEAFYTNHGNLFSSHQGTRLLHFGIPEAYTSSAVPTWPTVANGRDKRFPFLLTNYPENSNNYGAVPETSSHPHPTHNSPFANVNPQRVHSLLSSPRPIQNSALSHQIGPSASLQFECPAHQYFRSSTPVPQLSTYTGNDMSMVSLSPDDLLEKRASQVLPFSWK